MFTVHLSLPIQKIFSAKAAGTPSGSVKRSLIYTCVRVQSWEEGMGKGETVTGLIELVFLVEK